VVRAVPGEDLLPTGERLRDADRVLVRLRAAEGEEGLLEVARPKVRQLLAEPGSGLVGHERRDVGKLLRLAGDRLGHALVAVPDVHAHELRVEVEVAGAADVPEVDALGPVDRDRGRLGLRLPVVERVALGLLDDLRRGHRCVFAHRSRSLARSRVIIADHGQPLTTSPPFITNGMSSSTVTSSSGSPSTAIRSANRPGRREPTRSPHPRSSAETTVALRIASIGV
jgi:hypothetical protein